GVAIPVRRPYSAPERMAGAAWDRHADVFSLAVLMSELLWGRRVSSISAESVAALTVLPGWNLDLLRTVFVRPVSTQPSDRFDTALDFAEAFRNACSGEVSPRTSNLKRSNESWSELSDEFVGGDPPRPIAEPDSSARPTSELGLADVPAQSA